MYVILNYVKDCKYYDHSEYSIVDVNESAVTRFSRHNLLSRVLEWSTWNFYLFVKQQG